MDIEAAVARAARSPAVEAVLRDICNLTDMGFAAVARVTETQWLACQLLDKIAFGLEPGSELEISTTICNEVRISGQPVFIDHVMESPHWRSHPVPLLYGFQSYVSVPLILADGRFFGTLCAIDPAPHVVDTPAMRDAIAGLADRVVAAMESDGT